MLYIIISDIHSNLEALEAVIEDFPENSGKEILCVGDIVGYGADPVKCIEKVEGLKCKGVLGNHDAVAVEKRGISGFNQAAAISALWTQGMVSSDSKEFLSRLPYILRNDYFTVVHGTLNLYKEFHYMITEQQAWKTFIELRDEICFVGHSHMPGVFILDGDKVSHVAPGKISIKKGRKYIINAGSIGQPRDNDPRACYCMYDTDMGKVEFRRVEYDIEKAAGKILRAGLPESLAERLYRGW